MAGGARSLAELSDAQKARRISAAAEAGVTGVDALFRPAEGETAGTDRPPLSDADVARSANGRLIATTRTDPGTPQLQKKRRRLVGEGADPVLATSPLDILYARDLVDADTLAAAEWFRQTARLVLGAPHPRNVLDPQRGTEPSEAAQRWAEIRYCFIAETIHATRRGELLNLIHFCSSRLGSSGS